MLQIKKFITENKIVQTFYLPRPFLQEMKIGRRENVRRREQNMSDKGRTKLKSIHSEIQGFLLKYFKMRERLPKFHRSPHYAE